MDAFREKIINVFKSAGQKWLVDLPQVVDALTNQWGLNTLQEIEKLSFNYILSGYRNNQPIILKISPDREALEKEAATLQAYQGYGGIGLLEYDADKGALLLERAEPGKSLKELFPDHREKIIEITCDVMTKLHQAPIHEPQKFYNIGDWLSSIDKDGPIPKQYLEKARILKKQLLDTLGKPVLLHGDLHHENILLNGSEWVVIDPKGILGEALSDIWPFIHDPETEIPHVAQILKQDPHRVRDWCFVHFVGVAKWNLENNLNAPWFMDLIAKIDKLYAC